MIIELIPKRERKPIFGQVFFLIVSLAVVLSVGAGFFILELFISNAREELTRLERAFTEDTRPLEQALEQELQEYRRNLSFLKVALDERRTLVPVFGLLEATTHPDVFFRSFRGDGKTGVFVLEGQAKDFVVLEQQRLVWNNQNAFEARLQDIELGTEGTGNFKAEIVVNPDLLLPL